MYLTLLGENGVALGHRKKDWEPRVASTMDGHAELGAYRALVKYPSQGWKSKRQHY
jgi:hypothetical protein